MVDVIEMFGRAAATAAGLARQTRPDQGSLPTPCAEWDVAALLVHMGSGPAYLLGALGVDGSSSGWPEQQAVDTCVAALRDPGALERTCQSPAGFEWTVGTAAAGTAMDQLLHTWDLAVALDTNRILDPELVDAVVAMFLPHMPDIGRQAGIVGPAVPLADDAPAQDRLLAAMGRDPRR